MIEISFFTAALYVFMFLIGASIGSFINMASYRIPQNISILAPRSFCNNCKTVLSFLALIPIFGYIFSRGKCSKCGMRIPLEYPLIELLCGLFFVTALQYYGTYELLFISPMYFRSLEFISFITVLWLFSTGLLLSIIDLKYQILPDIIVLPGILVGLVLGSLNPNLGFVQSCVGILVGGLGLFTVSKLYALIRKKEGMGFGDVKYLAFLGAVLGWQGVLFTLMIASVLGTVIGIPMLLIQKKHLHTPIPFGPCLAFAALVVFIVFYPSTPVISLDF